MFTNAALYTDRDPPDDALLRGLPGVERVEVTRDRAGRAARYRVAVNGVTLTMNVMPEAMVEQHLSGFYGYLLHLTDQKPSPHAGMIARKIQGTRTVLGCQLEPGMDREAMAGDLLFFLNHQQNGLLFARDTIFGPDGNALVGPLAEQG